MAILDSNGQPYQVSGSIQQFDPNSQEHDLFNLWDQEIIMMGGSPLYYYEVFISSANIDPLYLEARNKLYSNNPIQLYGLYEPIRSQNQMSAFGIDSPDDMQFELNYRAVLSAIGHMPKLGSRLHSPHMREDWEIIQCNRGEFKLWGALRLQIVAKRFQETVTTGQGKVSTNQNVETFKLI